MKAPDVNAAVRLKHVETGDLRITATCDLSDILKGAGVSKKGGWTVGDDLSAAWPFLTTCECDKVRCEWQ